MSDERAEQAFRDALGARADELRTAPLVAPVRRRRSGPLVAAAAVAVIAVATSVTLLSRDGDRPAATQPAATQPAATPTTATPTAVPGLGDVRTVSFKDVAVEVPTAWGDAYAPTHQWCIAGRDGGRPTRTDFPTQPYVARDASTMGTTLVACGGTQGVPEAFPPVPPTFWAPHLSLVPVIGGEQPTDSVTTYAGWTLTTRVVGTVSVQLLTDDATTPLVDAILGTVRTQAVDGNGCDTTSPAQAAEFVRPPAFDLESAGAISTIAVCQYQRGRTDEPGLLASRVLTGSAAQDVVDAVLAAPAGGGPDRPENCVDDLFGDQALVLRLSGRDAIRGDLYVYYDWCFGNGIDDGTTRRAITEANCSPLWGAPVLQYGGDGATYRLCHPEDVAG